MRFVCVWVGVVCGVGAPKNRAKLNYKPWRRVMTRREKIWQRHIGTGTNTEENMAKTCLVMGPSEKERKAKHRVWTQHHTYTTTENTFTFDALWTHPSIDYDKDRYMAHTPLLLLSLFVAFNRRFEADNHWPLFAVGIERWEKELSEWVSEKTRIKTWSYLFGVDK